MATTREEAAAALLALLSGAGDFQTVGRRNRAPESFKPEQTPALMLLNRAEEYKRPSPTLPPIRKMHFAAVTYFDAGDDENVVPSAVINDILDRFDALLVADRNGFCTLGGLVFSAVIDGEVVMAPGDVTGKSLAITPIIVALP